LPDATVDERHLTSLLRETLDERFTGFHAMPYGLRELKADLAKDDSAVKVSLTIEANEYSTHVENRLTQADLGIVLKYNNFFRPDDSFSKAALFQAKRIFASSRHSQTYSDRDIFKSLEVDQLRRIIDLDRRHSHFIYYLFYGPRAEAYDEQSRKALRYLTLPTGRWRDHHSLHWIEENGFLHLWTHVYEYASDPNRYFPGLLASRPSWLEHRYFEHQTSDGEKNSHLVPKAKQNAPTVREVYERMWQDTYALSWFLVYRMMMGYEGSSDDEAMRIASGGAIGPELGIAPRYTLELRISVGGEGPDVFARAAGVD
jgi:hypothetical protein